MKKKFSKAWVSSKQPRKQRKYRYNAPLHVRSRMVVAHLSSELRKRVGKRSLAVRKSDTVKVMTGSFKGKSGKVNSINLKSYCVYIDGIETIRRDGTKAFVPVNASNLLITEMTAEDKKRLNHG